MDVNGINSVGRAYPVSQPKPVNPLPPATNTQAPTPRDEVEISSAGKMLDNLSRASSLREERIAQIKAAIADGTYDTPEKLELALDRLLQQHGLGDED